MTGTKTAPSPKQPQQASKNIGAAAKPSPSMTNQALSNVAAKLSNSGVTLSKPVSRYIKKTIASLFRNLLRKFFLLSTV